MQAIRNDKSQRRHPGGASLCATRILLLCAAAAVLACGSSPRFVGEALVPPRAAAEIQGLNWDGDEFRLSDLRGNVVLVFFGYTACPDVCPATLSRMKGLYDRLGSRADGVSVVLVSVDPERDTLQRLEKLVTAFDSRFFGVSLEPEVLWGVRRNYRIQVEKHFPAGPSALPYSLDHSGWIFAIDAAGRLRSRLRFDARGDDLQNDVELLLAEVPEVASGPALSVEGAWAREALGSDASAAYLSVCNESDRSDRLLRVETPAAAHSMLHESVHQAGLVRMQTRDRGLEIAAGATLELVPGGKHIMFHGLQARFAPGDSIDLLLHFERAGVVRVSVPVRAIGAERV